MNRQQRRKALKCGLVFKTETFTREQIMSMGRICGWQGCDNSCPGDLPAGWVNLFTYWSARPVLQIMEIQHWQHDKVLCPEHAAILDEVLKPYATGVSPLLDNPLGTA
jgi:hypothetical protein